MCALARARAWPRRRHEGESWSICRRGAEGPRGRKSVTLADGWELEASAAGPDPASGASVVPGTAEGVWCEDGVLRSGCLLLRIPSSGSRPGRAVGHEGSAREFGRNVFVATSYAVVIFTFWPHHVKSSRRRGPPSSGRLRLREIRRGMGVCLKRTGEIATGGYDDDTVYDKTGARRGWNGRPNAIRGVIRYGDPKLTSSVDVRVV